MPNEALAKYVFQESRRLYEAGFKSANKRYDIIHASWWKSLSGKAVIRNDLQPAAARQLGQFRNQVRIQNLGILNAGAYLLQKGVPAANCGDLANLACYIARQQGAQANELAVANVVTPNRTGNEKGADHAFALYGEPQMLRRMSQMTTQISGIANARTLFRNAVYAIDPWANLWCWLDKYPGKVADKMKSWSSDGKRVLWIYNDNNPPGHEWAVPGGEYAQVFAAASIKVTIC